MKKRIASIDIGSTITKGALFEISSSVRVLSRGSCPTTPENLALGFDRVLKDLLEGHAGKAEIRFSSSAKGGLRIAAVGLVPDLTLQVARLAAWSAGGRVVADSAYKLSAEKLREILSRNPDIILLSGGTDGGNEAVVLGNARRIAASDFSGTVLYAGNAEVRSEVEEIFAGKELKTAENLMPVVGSICTEEAGRAIQRIFLETIVEGRGLSEVAAFCKGKPKPTPLAVFDLVSCIGERMPDWKEFCLIDLGGATTDFYSHAEAFPGESGVFLRGLHEPLVKRSVEGDLGLRVSAEALFVTAREFLLHEAARRNLDFFELEAYVRRIDENHKLFPSDPTEAAYDSLLALAACTASAARHAGRLEESYTPMGRVYLQTGKDLRRIGRLIGTGGYLSRIRFGSSLKHGFAGPAAEIAARGAGASEAGAREAGAAEGSGRAGGIRLLPAEFRYFRDTNYLFPLLGNISDEFPAEAAEAAVRNLEEEE
jgi:uncharacterized protein (TIGR01319 family)